MKLQREGTCCKPAAFSDRNISVKYNAPVRTDLYTIRSLGKENNSSSLKRKAPIFLAEVSRNNRVNDMIKKTSLYGDIGLRYYIITDSDVPLPGKITHTSTVWVGKLENGAYKFTDYGPG